MNPHTILATIFFKDLNCAIRTNYFFEINKLCDSKKCCLKEIFLIFKTPILLFTTILQFWNRFFLSQKRIFRWSIFFAKKKSISKLQGFSLLSGRKIHIRWEIYYYKRKNYSQKKIQIIYHFSPLDASYCWKN